MSMMENMALGLFKTAMQNPAIKAQVEDAVKHVLDVHDRVERIEQKLDTAIANMNLILVALHKDHENGRCEPRQLEYNGTSNHLDGITGQG